MLYILCKYNESHLTGVKFLVCANLANKLDSDSGSDNLIITIILAATLIELTPATNQDLIEYFHISRQAMH